jgi:hypothetical protein
MGWWVKIFANDHLPEPVQLALGLAWGAVPGALVLGLAGGLGLGGPVGHGLAELAAVACAAALGRELGQPGTTGATGGAVLGSYLAAWVLTLRGLRRAWRARWEPDRTAAWAWIVLPTGTPQPPPLARLGLTIPCTLADVRAAYHRQAKLIHPDAGGQTGEFIALVRAYRSALAMVRATSGSAPPDPNRQPAPPPLALPPPDTDHAKNRHDHR